MAPITLGTQAAMEPTMVNHRCGVAVTEEFMPLLLRAPGGTAKVLSTLSGVGARTLDLVSDAFTDPALDPAGLRVLLAGMLDELGTDPQHPCHAIPTIGYGLSKLGVNVYTQILARQHPTLLVNACSPGFTRTVLCTNYTGTRVPKDSALGDTVFGAALFGPLGEAKTRFFPKEMSSPG